MGAFIGDAYNLGTVKARSSSNTEVDVYAGTSDEYRTIGGIIGVGDFDSTIGIVNQGISGRTYPSYYVGNNIVDRSDNVVEGVNFGNNLSSNEMMNIFAQNWNGNSIKVHPYESNGGAPSSGTTGGDSTSGNSTSGGASTGGATSGGTADGTSTSTGNIASEDDLKRYNDFITSIQQEGKFNPSSIPTTPQQKILPTMTEKRTKSERTFDITPGYYQPGYITDGGGLFVYNLNVDTDPNAEKPLSFDLYNEMNATGYIEFYDENGNYITAERIDPHSHVITSIEKWWSEATKLTKSIVEHGLESPITDEYNSTWKPITAPAGTHKIVVTNNPNASLYGQVSNAVDDWFEAVDMAATLKSVYGTLTSLGESPQKVTVNQILDNVKEEVIKQIMIEATKEATKEAAKDAGKEVLNTLAQEGTQELLVNILEGIDKKKILEDALADTFTKHGGEIAYGAGKSAAKTMVSEMSNGNPGVLGYKLMMAVGKSLNELSNEITEKKLENVRPMVFQLNY